MTDFFVHKDIYLRAVEPEDLDVLYRWENDTRLWRNGGSITPFSRFVIRQYIADSMQDIFQTKQLRMMIVEKETDIAVGTIDLYEYDELNRRAAIGILVDEDYRQNGYGLQALECIGKYAFIHLKLHQLYAFVPEKNIPSLTLFTKAGYEKTAVLKDWLSYSTSYQNVIVMQLVLRLDRLTR